MVEIGIETIREKSDSDFDFERAENESHAQFWNTTPLISFTLSELYNRRDPDNRSLTAKEYKRLGGVIGALRH